MEVLLFVVLGLGLGYCLMVIALKLIGFFMLYRQFKFLSCAFNAQYKALRPFIGEELTDEQIFDSISEEEKEDVFCNNHLCIMFTNDKGVSCKNTVIVRECFIKVGMLLQQMSDVLFEDNNVSKSKIIMENLAFIRELKEICIEKGEPTFYKNLAECDNNNEDETDNKDEDGKIMFYDDYDDPSDYGADFSSEEYYCEYDEKTDDDEVGNNESCNVNDKNADSN